MPIFRALSAIFFICLKHIHTFKYIITTGVFHGISTTKYVKLSKSSETFMVYRARPDMIIHKKNFPELLSYIRRYKDHSRDGID